MYKKSLIVLLISTIAVAAVTLGVITAPPRQVVKKEEKRITFVAPMVNTGYWGRAGFGAIQAGEKLGIDVKCVSSYVSDREKMISNLESAVYADVDGIITVGIEDFDKFNRALDMAAERGIPIVLIDSDISNEKRYCYIGTDNYLAGQTAADSMAKACGYKGDIVVIVSYLDDPNQIGRLNGFKDTISKYPEMTIQTVLEGKLSTSVSRHLISEALEENRNITGVFCAEGTSSIAICQLLENTLYEERNLTVVTFELGDSTIEAMKEGKVEATIQQNSCSMGEKAVEVLNRCFKGEEQTESSIYTETLLIDKENLDEQTENKQGSVEIQWHIY
ncbi:MAG: substrate-binding domain-containing protein [Eubacteriales bacterium]|nr:substrate-binding domain-containing protein [Eubacteriales bacterium]